VTTSVKESLTQARHGDIT